MKLIIIKIGGNILDNPAKRNSFLADFSAIGGPKILIHGGGKIATDLGKKLGIEPKMHEGRRITDEATLDLVTMVYGGLINKQLVAQLQALGCNALGISGADGNAVLASKRPMKEMDYGFVGDVERVNATLLNDLLTKGLTPVLAPLTHDGKGNMLNTNADTMAAEIAKALTGHFETTLLYCFEKKGVLRDVVNDDSVVPLMNKTDFEHMKAQGQIAAGMIPKLTNAFAALEAGVQQVVVMHADDLNNFNIGLQTGTALLP